MKKRHCHNIAAVVCLILLLTTHAEAQIYQYTDKNGNVVFTDAPPAESNAKEARMKEEGVYFSAPRREQAARGSGISTSPGSMPDKKQTTDYGSVTVEMYMTSWCGYCKQAGAYVRSLGANLVQYDIEVQPVRKAEMKQKSGGTTSVPLIDIRGTIIHGYNPGAIKAAMDKVAAQW